MCRRLPPPFLQATAYGSYECELRELLHLLKYADVRPAVSALGGMLAEAIRPLLSQGEKLLVIPVPLHRGKRGQRGFNQSELLAHAAVRKLKSKPRPELDTRSLVRTRATMSQAGLTQHQRRANMRGAFRVARPAKIADRDIILVDDIFTTGTTVTECARVLLRAGARKVMVATVARVPKGLTRPEVTTRKSEISGKIDI